jgi:hypothetical protein
MSLRMVLFVVVSITCITRATKAFPQEDKGVCHFMLGGSDQYVVRDVTKKQCDFTCEDLNKNLPPEKQLTCVWNPIG